MDREKLIVPNQIGYLILKEDGAVLESGGDLKNDERSANVIMGLLNLTETCVFKQRMKEFCNNYAFIVASTSPSCRAAAARGSPSITSITTTASACPTVEYTSLRSANRRTASPRPRAPPRRTACITMPAIPGQCWLEIRRRMSDPLADSVGRQPDKDPTIGALPLFT